MNSKSLLKRIVIAAIGCVVVAFGAAWFLRAAPTQDDIYKKMASRTIQPAAVGSSSKIPFDKVRDEQAALESKIAGALRVQQGALQLRDEQVINLARSSAELLTIYRAGKVEDFIAFQKPRRSTFLPMLVDDNAGEYWNQRVRFVQRMPLRDGPIFAYLGAVGKKVQSTPDFGIKFRFAETRRLRDDEGITVSTARRIDIAIPMQIPDVGDGAIKNGLFVMGWYERPSDQLWISAFSAVYGSTKPGMLPPP